MRRHLLFSRVVSASLAFAALCAFGLRTLDARAQNALPSPSTPLVDRNPIYSSVSRLTKHIAELKAKAREREEDREKTARLAPDSNKKHAGKTRNPKPIRKDAGVGNTQNPKFEEEDAGTDYLEAYLFYLKQRAFPHDSIDWAAYQRAVAHRDQMPAAQFGKRKGVLALGSNWTFLGPKNLPVPYRQYYGQGNISGRVNALAYDKNNPGTYYLGAAGGGLWRTPDYGANWAPLSDAWLRLQVSSIAVDPTNSNTIYVGTGDFDGFGGLGFGIMKSTDGGSTWTWLGATEFGWYSISAILVDPENPNIVTVASGRGAYWYNYVYRSTDGGSTWNAVITEAFPWSGLACSAKDLSGTRYYYAVGHYGGGQVYRSSDRGTTWFRLGPPLSLVDWYDHDSLEVATSPNNPDIVYLIVGHDRKIFASGNHGTNGSWVDITGTIPGGYNWSQSWYDVHINASSRSDTGADVLYAGLITLALGNIGGSTWQDIGLTYDSTGALTHNDQHCAAVNPNNPNELLVGNDGGVYRLTYDPPTNSWSFDTTLNRNLGITQFYRMDAHPTDPDKVLGGTQDNATPVLNGDLSNWLARGGGDGGFCAINPSNPSVQYATSQYLHIYQTTDAWASGNWWGTNVITPWIANDRVAFIAPITLDPSSPNLLYAGTNYLWRYDANTNTWTGRLGGQNLAGLSAAILCIAVAPTDGNRIYTGSDEGEVWMTTDAGATWTQITSGVTSLPELSVTSLIVDPANPSKLYVGLGGGGYGHIWRCDDTLAGGARTWTDLSGAGATSLPDFALNSIALDIDDPANTYYVGSDVGVFYTNDGGANWANATQPLGLPNVQVNDLKAVTGTRKLYAATYGRGIWRIDLVNGSPAMLSSLTVSPETVNGSASCTGTVTLTSAAPSDTVVALSTNNAAATVPSTVTVLSGNTQATFSVTTTTVAADTPVTLTASLNAVNKTATLTVLAVRSVTALSLSPTSLAGGNPSTGKVTLNLPALAGGAVVTLTSSKSQATVPDSVTVPQGATQATFTVTTVPVLTQVSATISAKLIVIKSKTLTIKPPAVKSVSILPSSVWGGSPATGTVTLTGPATTGDVVVTLLSNHAEATVPASVTVLAGQTTATFTVNTVVVYANVTATISATGGGVTKTDTVVVKSDTVYSVSLTPTTVTGGASSAGKVTLTAAAGPGGVIVTLSSDNAAATVPATVTVPAGLKTATFTVNTTSVGSQVLATIKATIGASSKTKLLTINP